MADNTKNLLAQVSKVHYQFNAKWKPPHYGSTFLVLQVQLFKPIQGSTVDIQDHNLKIMKRAGTDMLWYNWVFILVYGNIL